MFEIPSLANIVVSTIVFIIAAWYIKRYCDEQDIPKGMMRSLSIFALAYLVSWGAGGAVDWLQGPQPKSLVSQDASQLLKQLGGSQP